MLVTRAMTARRTEQFLKELQFQLADIQHIMISAYARNSKLTALAPNVAVRTDYRKDAKIPSEANYIVEIYTDYDDYSQEY